MKNTTTSTNTKNLETATFAGGCFWCMEGPFEAHKGVSEVLSGYTGGHKENPSYEEVSNGGTGHFEAIEVFYDPKIVSYQELLDIFWMQIDPTDAGGQFVDRGDQYRAAIFYKNEKEKELAEASKKTLGKSGRYSKPIVTLILPASIFYPAELYHQDYYKNNPIRYHFYRSRSGRDNYLDKVWTEKERKTTNTHHSHEKETKNMSSSFQKPSDEELKKKLTPLQYDVTQKDGTERAFDNEYWNNHRDGIYVDVVSGEVLFSSKDKYESGTGWPSFFRPLEPENIVTKKDKKFFITRTEVRSKHADSHLGHVFKDGPKPTGLRYCMNSAAMRFIAKEDLEKEGYGKYLKLFEK